ncbi:V-type proton ATPase subunit E-like [Olea europaea subsp. europaea]|uniref:V-type proton ATPase subunit E-like n=1 Tax=Olea europaea subsp. europaea TaxID=158383 RepID=A0A8S0PET0_OLEEU|nr:V-type proton ATPase subunit E-like [Olea europaea subsp. europaea]
MVRFIRQEAEEKVNKISVFVEEEFDIEKLQLVEAEKKKSRQEFERKDKLVQVRKKIDYSMQLNASRIKVLQAYNDLISSMKEAESKELLHVILVLQSLLRLKEPSVLLCCRKEDMHLVNSILHSAKEEYAEKENVYPPEIIVDNVHCHLTLPITMHMDLSVLVVWCWPLGMLCSVKNCLRDRRFPVCDLLKTMYERKRGEMETKA